MSELLQSAHHPDADQLNAFVEHALPAQEREETLAHLALCPDCRAVVALSPPPLEETLPQPEPARAWWSAGRWFPGWRLLWPVATAAAFIALVAAGVHVRSASTAPQYGAAAEVAAVQPPPPAPATPPQATEPRQRQTVSPQIAAPARIPAAPVVAAPPKTQGLAQLPLLNRMATAKTVPPPQTASAAPSAAGVAPATAGAAPASISANGASIATNQSAAIPLPQTAQATIDTVAAAPTPAQSGLAASAATPAAVSSPVVRSARLSARSGAPARPTLDLAQAILSGHPLPSGLPALSLVTSPHEDRTLAVDTHGNLFFSDDFGTHWNPVSAPWPGRALKVALAFSGSSQGARMFASSAPKRGSQLVSQANSVGGPLPLSNGVASTSLSGTITDVSGAIVPGATVIVSESPTQLARLAKTDVSGRYVIDNLSAGTYKVEVEARGFNTQQLAGVAVTPDKPALANLSLQVGALSQTVEVTAATSEVALNPPAIPKKAVTAARIEMPPSTFEITTDTGERWVSTDGQTWKRK